MRVLLSILKWLGLAIAAFLVWLFGWPWVPVLQDNLTSGSYVSYLEANVDRVDLAAADPGFDFPEAFYQHRLFFFSEIHGYAAPQDFDFALLKHLNERAGVRYYLAEMDPAQALAVNLWFETGDDTLIGEVFDSWAGEAAQWGNKEFFAKLAKIKALNDTLSADRQIRFAGVDQIQNRDFAGRVISLIQHGEGEEERPVDKLNLSMLETALALEEPGSRYASILRNTGAVAAAFPAGTKFYGMWGLFHGMQVPVAGREPLAMQLQEDGPFAGEVVTLTSFYTEFSMSMMQSKFLPPPLIGNTDAAYALVPSNNDDTYLYYVRGINDLKKVAGDDQVTVFNLRGEGTPYRGNRRLMKSRGFIASMQPFVVDGSASEAADYAVLFQASPALTPWKGEAYDVTAPPGE